MGPGHIFLINSKLYAACWCYLHEVLLARPLTSPPLQNEGKESPVAPGSPRQAGGARTGQVRRLVLALCYAESRAGNRLFLKLAQALLLSFRETTVSSTRQKARAANGEQKHHGKSCSLHCRVRFTILLFLSQKD